MDRGPMSGTPRPQWDRSALAQFHSAKPGLPGTSFARRKSVELVGWRLKGAVTLSGLTSD